MYRGVQTGWRAAKTDANGYYSIAGLYDGIETIATRKEGFQDAQIQAPINGDTRIDLQLLRR